MQTAIVANKRGSWGVGLALLTACFLAGCEDSPNMGTELDSYFDTHPYVSDPRTDPNPPVIAITPTSASLNQIGLSAVFRAMGGEGPYTWDVANSRGSLTVDAWSSATYTCNEVGDNNVIVYDRQGHAAIAYITGSVTNTTPEPVPPDALTVGPETTLSGNGDLAVLTVSGGVPPYTWTVTDPGKGNLPSGNTGDSQVYIRYTAGDNAVTVTDSAGTVAHVVIKQP